MGIPLRIQDTEIAGADFREMQAVRIDQEAIRLAGNGQAEMIADTFVEIHPHSPPEGGREVDPGLFFLIDDRH